MPKTRISIVACAALALGACQRHALDSQVIGSWYYAPSIDDQSGVTYTPDHAFIIWSEDGADRREMIFGTWHIEGTQVVMDYKESWASRQVMDELHKDFAPFQRRDSIAI